MSENVTIRHDSCSPTCSGSMIPNENLADLARKAAQKLLRQQNYVA
jgi:hypothetical protein